MHFITKGLIYLKKYLIFVVGICKFELITSK